MKKNRMMRVAVLMLALVLMTSCFVGGTFAKYTTGGDTAGSARVAHWGVEVYTYGDETIFANEYKSSLAGKAEQTVVKSDEMVVAPGTNSAEAGANLIFGIKGTPEVATQVTVNFEGSDVFYGSYYPVEFTLYILDQNAALDAATATWDSAIKVTGTLAQIEAKVQEYYASFENKPGETLDALFKLTWEWKFDGNDEWDTRLGDLAAAGQTDGTDVGVEFSTVLNYSVEVKIEQVD